VTTSNVTQARLASIHQSVWVCSVAVEVLEELREGEQILVEMADELGVSEPTVHRAIRWLRGLGAPISFRRRLGARPGPAGFWCLGNTAWELPKFEITEIGFRIVGEC